MTVTETLSILEAAQKIFGLTKAELEKLQNDPRQLGVIADVVADSKESNALQVFEGSRRR